MWQQLHDELNPRGVEIVGVALDLVPERARHWVDAANATNPNLVDTAHKLDELLGFVNVPMAVWIDEEGVLVRPAETCVVERSTWADHELPGDVDPVIRDMLEQVKRIPRFDPDVYLDALRDWAARGSESVYALTPEQVIARSAPRPMDSARAAAEFELGQHLHHAGFEDDARSHFREAHRLQPENWTYKRNAWELVSPGIQGPTEHYEGDWLTDIKASGPERYYAPPRL